MTNLNSRGVLSAVELAFYSPAFLISVGICIKHGFRRSSGWLYMVLISVFRIIGASTTLYMETQNDYSSGLLETAAITSAIGTAPLLLALLGFNQRINESMDADKAIKPMLFRAVSLIALVALVLAIVGGSEQSGTTTSTTGKDCMEAGAILFLCVWFILAGTTLLTASRSSYIPSTEKLLRTVCVLVLPFLLVRVIYTVATAFGSAGGLFYFKAPNVWVQAFMMFAMEAIALILYIAAGLFSPKQTPKEGKDLEMAGPNGGYVPRQQQGRVLRAQPQQERYPQQERSLGDYRPSRMIRNAIRGN